MFNFITGKQFEHTFDEIMESWNLLGVLGSTDDKKNDAVQNYRKVWNYYSEVKNAEEVKVFRRPDARTKLGKHARELCVTCGLYPGHVIGFYGRYRAMCRADARLSGLN